MGFGVGLGPNPFRDLHDDCMPFKSSLNQVFDSLLVDIILGLLIYIDEKCPPFIPPKDEILVQKRQLFCIIRRMDDVGGL